MTKSGRMRRQMNRAPTLAAASAKAIPVASPTVSVAPPTPEPLAPLAPRARLITAGDAKPCGLCGALSRGPGGRIFPVAGWACTWCTRWTTSEDNLDMALDFAVGELVGLRHGTRKVGSGDLLPLPPPGGSGGGVRFAHVDVDDLRQRFRERFGANSIPPSEPERMRAAISAKRARAESAQRVKAARILRLERKAARVGRELRRVQGGTT